MTQKDPGTDFNPKHRILGAVILVSAAVVFVPMILSEREPPAAAVAPVATAGADRPPEETKVAVTDLRRLSSEPAAAKPAPPADGAPEPTETTAKPGPPAPATARTITSTVPQPAASPVEPAKPAPRVDKGWVVQVGTFSNTDNAERLEARLRQRGHVVRTEPVKLEGGEALRLRVGPFRDKSLALKAQAQIQKEIGVQGVVLAYP